MNREQWLTEPAQHVNTDIFIPLGKGAVDFRVSVGFPPKGGKPSASGKVVVGVCFPRDSSAANIVEIFISPILATAFEAIDTLGHEMVHAIVGNECGHKGPFKRLALAIGLNNGKMTEAKAGPELTERLNAILEKLPEYPHAQVMPDDGKKQSTRLIKVICTECDNVARQAKTPFVAYGLVCGACNIPMVADS